MFQLLVAKDLINLSSSLLTPFKSIKEKNPALIIDESVIPIGSQYFWLWIATELIRRPTLEYTSQKKHVCSNVSLYL